MEVFVVNIRKNFVIVGLDIFSFFRFFVFFFYVDDIFVVVLIDRVILVVFEVYDSFEKVFGFKINLGKCEGLWLGFW